MTRLPFLARPLDRDAQYGRRLMMTLCLLLLRLGAGRAHAGCNLIPSATRSFRGTLGATDRPFAGPNDFVELALQPTHCDGASPGFAAAAEDNVVTLVFTPEVGPRHVVVLTAADCNAGAVRSKLATCEATSGVGVGRVSCVTAPANDLAVAMVGGDRRLKFRFPDTEAALGTASGRTFAGPATIAVSRASDPFPCGLATTSCAAQGGLLACVDDLYTADGTCQQNLDDRFQHFTALPARNDFVSDCFLDPPCNPSASEIRMAVDAGGNLLMPVNWSGILTSLGGVPVPRLIHATITSPFPFDIPSQSFLASITPEGAPLPPIFEPQTDLTVAPGSGVLTMFGSIDAPATVLRIARRNGRCAGGPTPGAACTLNEDCGSGGTCPLTCVGGSSPGTVCTTNGNCPGGGRCGALFDDFATLASDGGPLVLARTGGATPVCQEEPHQTCTGAGDCLGVSNACVDYAFEAGLPVPLDGLAGSPDVFTFTVAETVPNQDLNDDGDTTDSVVVLRDRDTGETLPIGAGGADALAVVKVSQSPFRFPALASENQNVAFLQPELLTGPAGTDLNLDGDVADTILRVFHVAGGVASDAAGNDLAVDPALIVNGRSVAISNGRVFFRTPESAVVPQALTRVGRQVPPIGNPLQAGEGVGLSANGRFVLFTSDASDLVLNDTNGTTDVFVYDRQTATTERVSVATGGGEANGYSFAPYISADGRYVVFSSVASNLVPGFASNYDVFLRDRLLGTTEAVSVNTSGLQPNGGSGGSGISDDGRYVLLLSSATDLVPGDVAGYKLFVRDRQSQTNQIVSVNSAGQLADGPLYNASLAAMSGDGNVVVFETTATNLAPGFNDGQHHLYTHDRTTGVTEAVDVTPDGSPGIGGGNIKPAALSFDGRYVAFMSGAPALVPNGIGRPMVIVRDRQAGVDELISRAPDGAAPGGGASFPDSFNPAISRDGRYVAFVSAAANIVPGDTNACGGYTQPGECPDVFVNDRLTGITTRVSVAPDGSQGTGGLGSTRYAAISDDGRVVAFDSDLANLVTGDGDAVPDVFVRDLGARASCGNTTVDAGEDCDPPGAPACPGGTLCSVSCECNDLTQDGDVSDVVLQSIDASTSALTTLCPADQTVAAGGMTAFLRPEAAGVAAGCPSGPLFGGSPDLNGDADADDEVVHFWPGTGPVQNLGLAATALAMSDTTIAAITPTVQTHPTGAGSWTDSGIVAASITMCGPVVAMLTPAHELELYVPPPADVVVDTGQTAEELVCGATLIAFRTNEVVQGAGSLNLPDVDTSDDVLQAYDLSRPECIAASPPADCVANSGQALRTCQLPACDPRLPYRAFARSAKFLTFECDQGAGGVTAGCPGGGTDLNGDGDAGDLVIQVLDVGTRVTTVVGALAQNDPTAPPSPDNPLGGGDAGGGDDPTEPDSGTVFVGSGRCLETVGGTCTTAANCPNDALCDGTHTCIHDHGVCGTNADCPPNVACLPAPVVAASPDTDGDGVPDHVDDCPRAANSDQTDTDGDGVGDACDLATCGNGVREADEQCDGTDDGGCGTELCQPDCNCICDTPIPDAKASVKIKTLKEAGQLTASFKLPITYVAQAVSVRLDDADSFPIVKRSLGTLAPRGASGTKWEHVVRNDPVRVSLKQKSPTSLTVTVKTKHWFSAAAANLPKDATSFTITIGNQCFSAQPTKKTD